MQSKQCRLCAAGAQDDPRWAIADPICTFVFAGLVLLTTRAILRDISDILMERVPRSQNADTLQAGLQAVRAAAPPSSLLFRLYPYHHVQYLCRM
jgi:hypothetical protein